MKKLSKAKVNYRKHERTSMNKDSRRKSKQKKFIPEFQESTGNGQLSH